VCRWKTARSAPKVESNSASAIRSATGRAFASEELAEQINHLLELIGVGLPTASVLMHFAFPDAFPILDVRALESLGITGRSSYTPAFWTAYVTACREIATAHGVSLRTMDKALWQYSKESDESRSSLGSEST
jgi:hypothetical protein